LRGAVSMLTHHGMRVKITYYAICFFIHRCSIS
jgi:hypothetical protein